MGLRHSAGPADAEGLLDLVALAILLRPARALLAAAVLLAGCGRSDNDRGPGSNAVPAMTGRGPDALVLRLPRTGGAARVSAYAAMDSTIWTSTDPAPDVARILAFDENAGVVAYVDRRGLPGWLDFRLGTVRAAGRTRIDAVTSVDASVIYGIGGRGEVIRLTQAGDWTFMPPQPARVVFPQRDGSLLVLGGGGLARRGQDATVWRMRPPEDRLLDSVKLPPVERAMRTQVDDRIYFVSEGRMTPVRTRTMQTSPPIRVRHTILALTATPSGDRVFVATDSSRSVLVVDRFRDRVTAEIALPSQPRDLRMDPFGRYLLVRSSQADSVWIINVGTERLVGAVRSAWREDLPFIAADGAIALAQGRDVVFVQGETLALRERVTGGGADFWYSFHWTGFRPRAAGLDEPVQFPEPDTTPLFMPPEVPETLPEPDTAVVEGFTVSFAAFLSAQRAYDLAAQINVRGMRPRVVETRRDDIPVYRVVLGPYPTREEAERIGRESGQSYWVYQGIP